MDTINYIIGAISHPEIAVWVILAAFVIALRGRAIASSYDENSDESSEVGSFAKFLIRINENAPNLLILAGVFFTFVGIYDSLQNSDFRIDPKKGVEDFLEGMRTAFLSSVFGIFLSIAYRIMGYFWVVGNSTVKEINDHLDSAIGSNFKALNRASKELLVWQRNNKEQMQELVNAFKEAKKSLTSSARSMSKIEEATRAIPAHMESFEAIYERIQAEMRDATSIYGSFAEMKEKAEGVVSSLENLTDNVKKTIDGMVSEIQQQTSALHEQMKETLSDTKQVREQHLEDVKGIASEIHGIIENVQQEFGELAKQAVENMFGEIQQQTSDLHEKMKETLSDTKQVRDQHLEDMKGVAGKMHGIVADAEQEFKDLAKRREEHFDREVDNFTKDMNDKVVAYINDMGRNVLAITEGFEKQLKEIHTTLGKLVATLDNLQKLEQLKGTEDG